MTINNKPKPASDAIKANDTYLYFFFSEQQKKERTAIEKKLSRTFYPGKVIVNGKRKEFTEMGTKIKQSYPDTKIVAEGWKSNMTYTNIYTA